MAAQPKSGEVYYAEDGTVSMVLEDNFDPSYEPTEKELQEYAEWLGIDYDQEKDLMWIAREGLKAPLPKEWKPCKTDTGDVYYFNFNSGDSIWDHPLDDVYKEKVKEEREKLKRGGTSSAPKAKKTKDTKKEKMSSALKDGGESKLAPLKSGAPAATAKPAGPKVGRLGPLGDDNQVIKPDISDIVPKKKQSGLGTGKDALLKAAEDQGEEDRKMRAKWAAEYAAMREALKEKQEEEVVAASKEYAEKLRKLEAELGEQLESEISQARRNGERRREREKEAVLASIQRQKDDIRKALQQAQQNYDHEQITAEKRADAEIESETASLKARANRDAQALRESLEQEWLREKRNSEYDTDAKLRQLKTELEERVREAEAAEARRVEDAVAAKQSSLSLDDVRAEVERRLAQQPIAVDADGADAAELRAAEAAHSSAIASARANAEARLAEYRQRAADEARALREANEAELKQIRASNAAVGGEAATQPTAADEQRVAAEIERLRGIERSVEAEEDRKLGAAVAAARSEVAAQQQRGTEAQAREAEQREADYNAAMARRKQLEAGEAKDFEAKKQSLAEEFAADLAQQLEALKASHQREQEHLRQVASASSGGGGDAAEVASVVALNNERIASLEAQLQSEHRQAVEKARRAKEQEAEIAIGTLRAAIPPLAVPKPIPAAPAPQGATPPPPPHVIRYPSVEEINEKIQHRLASERAQMQAHLDATMEALRRENPPVAANKSASPPVVPDATMSRVESSPAKKHTTHRHSPSRHTKADDELAAKDAKLRAARQLLRERKVDIKARQDSLEKLREEWRRDMHAAKAANDAPQQSLLRKAKKVLESRAVALNQEAVDLHENSTWLRAQEEALRKQAQKHQAQRASSGAVDGALVDVLQRIADKVNSVENTVLNIVGGEHGKGGAKGAPPSKWEIWLKEAEQPSKPPAESFSVQQWLHDTKSPLF